MPTMRSMLDQSIARSCDPAVSVLFLDSSHSASNPRLPLISLSLTGDMLQVVQCALAESIEAADVRKDEATGDTYRAALRMLRSAEDTYYVLRDLRYVPMPNALSARMPAPCPPECVASDEAATEAAVSLFETAPEHEFWDAMTEALQCCRNPTRVTLMAAFRAGNREALYASMILAFMRHWVPHFQAQLTRDNIDAKRAAD